MITIVQLANGHWAIHYQMENVWGNYVEKKTWADVNDFVVNTLQV